MKLAQLTPAVATKANNSDTRTGRRKPRRRRRRRNRRSNTGT